MLSTQICESFIQNYLTKTEYQNSSFEKPYRLNHIIQNWANVLYPDDVVTISERIVIDTMRESGFLFDGLLFNAEYTGPVIEGRIPYKEFEWKMILR